MARKKTGPRRGITKNYHRRNVVEKRRVDTTRLYGASLLDSAQYLVEMAAEYPLAYLEESWTGHEDMELNFEWERPETPKEYKDRLRSEARDRRYAKEAQAREAQRRKDLAEYERLGNRLGIRR